MKALILISLTLTVMLSSCTSDVQDLRQTKLMKMFGPFTYEVGKDANFDVVTITYTDSQLGVDSVNRPGIAGATALNWKLLSDSSKEINGSTILVKFPAAAKLNSFELSNENQKTLLNGFMSAKAVCNAVCLKNKETLSSLIDTTSEVSIDSLSSIITSTIVDSAPSDSVSVYLAYPNEKKSDDKVVKVFRYHLLVYQKRKTYKMLVSINRGNGKLYSLWIIPQRDQREYSLPL